MSTLATLKRVPLDPAWKELLACATLEVFDMTAGVRLAPYIQPAQDPSAESAAQRQRHRQSGQTAMVGMADVL